MEQSIQRKEIEVDKHQTIQMPLLKGNGFISNIGIMDGINGSLYIFCDQYREAKWGKGTRQMDKSSEHITIPAEILKDFISAIKELFPQIFEPTNEEISTYAKLLSKRGGNKGGLARSASLSSTRKSQIARDAANKRWGNKTESSIFEDKQKKIKEVSSKIDG